MPAPTQKLREVNYGQTIVCSKCTKQSSSRQVDGGLDLSVSSVSGVYSFDDHDIFGDQVTVALGYRCGACGTRQNAHCTKTLISFPAALVIRWKVFSFDPVAGRHTVVRSPGRFSSQEL